MVLTFSTKYPAYHPRRGMATNFVQKIWASIGYPEHAETGELTDIRCDFLAEGRYKGQEKHHTIRAGNRFKAGDMFSPRIWGNDVNPKSGRRGTYQSKQIVIAPDTLIHKTWDFRIKVTDKHVHAYIDGKEISLMTLESLVKNDGLELYDFRDWFIKNPDFKNMAPFQIICWNEKTQY